VEYSRADAPVVKLPPGGLFAMDETLLETCYTLWRMSEFAFVPDPEYVARMPSDYLAQLFAWHQGVKYYEDQRKTR
jgi:hypothetical protein